MEPSLRAFQELETSSGVTVKLSNGDEVRLPLGFHFHPTEDQLVVHYLLPKTMNRQLPNYYVEEISDPFAINPPQLTIGGRDEDYGYFFSKQGTSFQENYSTTGGGCWIHVGSKLVLAVDGDEQVEAYRAKYLFLDCDCIFSGWKMYLYSLSSLRFVSKASFESLAGLKSDEDNWVVIRIFHEQMERQLYFNYVGREEDLHEEEDREQVSSNIVEDAAANSQQADQDSQINTGDVTPTSSCISSERFNQRLL